MKRINDEDLKKIASRMYLIDYYAIDKFYYAEYVDTGKTVDGVFFDEIQDMAKYFDYCNQYVKKCIADNRKLDKDKTTNIYKGCRIAFMESVLPEEDLLDFKKVLFDELYKQTGIDCNQYFNVKTVKEFKIKVLRRLQRK